MKSFIGAIICLLVLYSIGCQHSMPVEPINSTPSGLDKLIVYANNRMLSSSDTTNVVSGSAVFFRLSATVTVTHWESDFPDSSKVYDSVFIHTFSGAIGNILSVKFSGYGASTYSKVKFFRIVTSVSGYDIILNSDPTPNKPGYFTVTHLFREDAMIALGSGTDFVQSDQTSWQIQYIDTANINYLQNFMHSASGPFVRAQFIQAPGLYRMGAGRMVGGKAIWVPFYSPYCNGVDISYVLGTDGSFALYAPPASMSLPGEVGDVTDTAKVRYSLVGTNLQVYTKNGVIATTSFIRPYSDSLAAYQNVIPSSVVSGNANWAMASVAVATIKSGNLLFNIGDDSSKPNDFWPVQQSMKSGTYNKSRARFSIQVVEITTTLGKQYRIEGCKQIVAAK